MQTPTQLQGHALPCSTDPAILLLPQCMWSANQIALSIYLYVHLSMMIIAMCLHQEVHEIMTRLLNLARD